MRCCFTIILNGLHHLIAKNQAEFIVKNFDYWYIAEGASLSQGSTKWCKLMPDKYHNCGRSVDGTWQYLKQLTDRHPNVFLVNNILVCQKEYMENKFWKSKDAQVNACIHAMKLQKFQKCFLWQIDVDEKWDIKDIEEAELKLISANAKVGTFSCNYWVGNGLVARGIWGEGSGDNAYKRLWFWEGEWFKSHEPPILDIKKGIFFEEFITNRFNHYAYCYEQDVKFKDKWYGGHEGIYKRWEWLQNDAKTKPVGYSWPINVLLDSKTYWGRSDTYIIKVIDKQRKKSIL